MSKRDLKIYLTGLKKKQLELQIVELYDKFKEVKIYYNFAFKPNENQLVKEAKIKISNEYFPAQGKRPKMRRSVGQKFIKHFILLGVDDFIIADVSLFNIEIAQSLTAEKSINNVAFYKSMLTSFSQVVSFMIDKSIFEEFRSRVVAIKNQAVSQNWENSAEFETIVNQLEY